jgi:hypothetical protein
MTTVIVYYSIGLSTDPLNFFAFLFALINLIFCAASYGQLIGCVFTRPETASQLAPQMIVPLNILGGFYTNVAKLPVWVRWV